MSNLALDKWHDKVFGFLVKAAERVRPSSRLLNDSMDFNNYVKIKIIEWKDNSLTKYVHGIVMSKNVSHTQMPTQFKNPSIMVLYKLEIGQSDIKSEIDQEGGLLKILMKKIDQFKPDIIFVERDVPYKVMQCMCEYHADITIVSNMEDYQIARIARIA